MRSTTVVFRGITQVVDAYECNEMPTWAIVNGENILFADNPDTVEEGKALLDESLRRLHKGNSRAQFDLRVYAVKVASANDITNKTPHSRGFRFSLYEDEEMTPYEHGRQKTRDDYESRFTLLQDEIRELKAELAKAEEEVEEEPGLNVNKVIAGYLENPQIKQALSMRLIGLIDRIIPMPTQRPAAIAGIEMHSLLDQDQQQKVQRAINILCSKDARLGDHLLAIAKIAEDNPSYYITLTSMLK